MANLLFSLYVAFNTLFSPCRCENIHHEKYKFKTLKIGKMKNSVLESSGLELLCDSILLTHNDGGNTPEIFVTDMKGSIRESILLPGCINEDWEDLAKDEKGNLFIGDFGNNLNIRRDLKIYILKDWNDSIGQKMKIDTICFNYGDQLKFPPSPKSKNYDCEAFFYWNDSLFLFSKNRGNKFVKLYILPAKSGNYTVFPSDSIYLRSWITSADISPDKNQFALLGYGKIYLFTIQQKNKLLHNSFYCKKFARGQTEGLVYKNQNELVISNERGKLYLLKIGVTVQ